MMKKQILSLIIMLFPLTLAAQEQLYNMNFDEWSKSKGAWNPYAADGPKVWDTANHGTSIIGVNATQPEYKHLAVAGEGKAAAKITSRKVIWAFLAGNLYTGQFVRVVKFSGAEMIHGVPFHSRPKSISGYLHYIPGVIDYAKGNYKDMKGKRDQGQIEVALFSWKEPHRFDSTAGSSIPATQDPDLIGQAVMVLDKPTGGYIPFEIKFNYISDKTPSYLFMAALSSRLGGFFTGSSKSVLYLDELQFNY